MPRTRSTCRPLTRSVKINATRRLNRVRVRNLPGHRRSPSDLSQALSALTWAIRSHRHLARLDPSHYDATVMAREAREREERRRWMAEFQAALVKVYGPEAAAAAEWQAGLGEEPAPVLNLRVQRAIEREWALMQLGLAVGEVALARHHQRRPNAVPSLGQIARLILIGASLGHLSCGLDPCPPSPAALKLMPRAREALAQFCGSAKTKDLKHESVSG